MNDTFSVLYPVPNPAPPRPANVTATGTENPDGLLPMIDSGRVAKDKQPSGGLEAFRENSQPVPANQLPPVPSSGGPDRLLHGSVRSFSAKRRTRDTTSGCSSPDNPNILKVSFKKCPPFTRCSGETTTCRRKEFHKIASTIPPFGVCVCQAPWE
jgi:hypothetical protein